MGAESETGEPGLPGTVLSEPGFPEPRAPGPHRWSRLSLFDLPQLLRVERRAYEFPWTEGNLRASLLQDGLQGGLFQERELLGYYFAQVILDEAHLLNFTIDSPFQNRGWGRYLLHLMLEAARLRYCTVVFLEARTGNRRALNLYLLSGFVQVAVRKAYYPSCQGREDALVLRRDLS